MELDCQKCGACCFESDVLLNEHEVEYFARRPQLAGLVAPYDGHAGHRLYFLRRSRETDVCLAFRGQLGDCACGIYAERPWLCRELEAGSDYCLAARRRMGLDVPADAGTQP